ncbi:MAG: HAD-IA family hydrolase [Rhodospirillaceae bacterium]|nr:HAD-IA family hydrolase [Rhodospirillaceae bacterium]
MAAQTLLLDLDGTLWDSRPWYAAVLAQLSPETPKNLEHRLSTGTSIAKLTKECGVSNARLVSKCEACITSLQFYDGVLPTLEKLRVLGTTMGVVTNLPGWLAKPLATATGIEDYFDVFVTPRWGVPAKPNPHGTSGALQEIGQENYEQVWFVGDGEVDAKAANRADLNFAWASYGYETRKPPQTDIVLERFEEVLDL